MFIPPTFTLGGRAASPSTLSIWTQFWKTAQLYECMANLLMDAHRGKMVTRISSKPMLTIMVASGSVIHQATREILYEHPTSASQTSSFNDSMPSQLSETQLSAQEGLTSSQTFPTKVALTPATSFSNASSQEQAAFPDTQSDTPVNAQIAAKQHAVPPPALGGQVASQPSPERSPRNAPKRMADGELKSPVTGLPTSPTESQILAHSRNSSINSRNSQITEVG